MYFLFIFILILYQIPYLYQQVLSSDKTPTLCATVLAFEGFVTSLKKLQNNLEGDDFIWADSVIEAGIDKMSDYSQLFFEVPAYALAISEWLYYKAM
jgi:hypothetical protein